MDSTKGYDLSGADRTLKPRSESLGIADSQQQLEEEAQYDQASDVDTGSEMDVNTNENDRKDKKEHRLLVQALISAIIITICGFTTVMVHIASFIGFLAFQKRSLGKLFDF